MRRALSLLLLCTIAAAAPPVTASPPGAASFITTTTRDGSHDFDFLIGKWHYDVRVLKDRLKNSHVWYDCPATGEMRPIWGGIYGGSANREDTEIHCPNRTIGGITIRMYSAQTHQWSIWWGTREKGLLIPPPQVGHFDANGVGYFYADDTWKGTPVIVRFRWQKNLNGKPHFEQAFSSDHGKTWEVNWISEQTRY